MPDRKPFLDKLLSSSMFLRIVALIIALILWFYISGDKGTEMVRTIRCPVQYINAPYQTSLKNTTSNVDVQLSGERQILSRLDTEKVKCQVDLAGLDPGKYSILIRATVPRNVRLIDVIPSHARIEIARVLEKKFRVNLDILEGLPSGLFVDSVMIDPQEVKITGREDDISAIEKVYVSPTLEQLKTGGDINLKVKIDPDEVAANELDISPSEVKVNAVLARGIPKREIPVNVRLTGKPHPDFQVGSVSVEPVSVKVEGKMNELEKIDKVDTETFDITGVSADQHVILPLVPLTGESLNYLSESSVSVKVDIKPFTSTRVFPKVPVEVQGKSVYPSWSVKPDKVKVTLEAVTTDFKNMDDIDKPVKAYVNVTNIVSKKLTVPVIVEVQQQNVKVVSVEPSKVQVSAQIE